ncbi:MAG: D-glycerate dehydrogenase [Bacteroidetes bacterium]|nr:D-glycerate dehydrogenase [Bacteroidota bacterium]
MKKRVLITQHIPEEGIRLLENQFDLVYHDVRTPLPSSELLESCPDAAGVLCLLSDRISQDFISRLPSLKVISNYAVGINNIDLQAAKNRGVIVCNTPDVLTQATADLALGLLLAVARKLLPADRYCRNREFKGWASDLFAGFGFQGKQCGIIGMGKIGTAFAGRVKALGMTVVYHNRKIAESPEKSFSFSSLDDLIKNSDVISLHTPLTPETRHILSRERLLQMKKGSILINTGRGELIDEQALAEVLKSGHLYGAGLDVFENEPIIHPDLLTLDNVVLAPHIGSATLETRNEMAILAATAIIEVMQGLTPGNRVVI